MVGDQGGQGLAVRVLLCLHQRLAELPFGLGELAGRVGNGAEHAAAQRGRRRRRHGLVQGRPSGFFGQGQVQGSGQQPPFPAGPGRGDVRGPLQVRGGQCRVAGRRFAGGQLFQLGGQVLIGLLQGGDPVLPRRGLAHHRGRTGVHQAAPGGRDAGVDRVPDQRVADRHRAGGFFWPPLHQAGGHGRLNRRAGRADLRRLAQLGDGQAQVQHREHLQDEPGLGGREHAEVLADGGGQRPWQRVAPRRPRIEAGSLAQQRPQVQRVPARAAVQPPRHLIIERFGPERGRQCRHLAQAQAPQRYTQPVLHARQHPLGRFGQAVHGPPVGHYGDHRVHRQPPQHEGQRFHRCAVGPLQIINEDRRRPSGLLLSHHLEQPGAHGERRDGRAGLGRGPDQLARADRPQHLVDDPEAQVGLGRVGPGRGHSRPGALGLGFGQAAPRQRGLPDPRITLDGHQPRLPRRHPGDDLRDPGPFRGPAHEDPQRWRLPVPHAPTSLPLSRT